MIGIVAPSGGRRSDKSSLPSSRSRMNHEHTPQHKWICKHPRLEARSSTRKALSARYLCLISQETGRIQQNKQRRRRTYHASIYFSPAPAAQPSLLSHFLSLSLSVSLAHVTVAPYQLRGASLQAVRPSVIGKKRTFGKVAFTFLSSIPKRKKTFAQATQSCHFVVPA